MVDFVHLLCDYKLGDLAWAELASVFTAKLPDKVRLHLTSVRSFDTVSTGFALAQIGLAPNEHRPAGMLIFANTAPRKDRRDAKVNNEGEGLLYGKLKNGVQIVAVNSGFSLSFVREDLSELWTTNAEDSGSQFRSRDNFPRVVASIVSGDTSVCEHKLNAAEHIPPPPSNAVAYIDSFGNLKTTIRSGDAAVSALPPGQRVKIRLGSIVRTATIATGSFNVMEGDLAFAPGSSGYGRRYWELFVRGSSAWDEFGQPRTGSQIIIEG